MIQPARSPRVLAVLALGAQVLLSPAAFAASHTWTGTTNGNWSVGTNWVGGPPTNGETGVDLVFPNGQMNMGAMVNDVTGLAVTSITFSDTAYNVTGIAIGLAGTITVDGGTLNGVASVGLDIALTGDATFVAHGSPDLFLSIGGVISGGSNVVVTSANNPTGYVDLPNANTYTGMTTVHDGYLIISNALSLGVGDGTPATGTVIGPNGTLNLQGVTVANEALSAGGSGANGNGAIQSGGAVPNSWQGPITLTSPGTIVAATTGNPPLTLAGNVSESAQGSSFTFRAAATVTLTGNNTYFGTDQIEYGTVIYNGMSFGNLQTNLGGLNSLPAPTLAGTGTVQAVTVGGASATSNVIDPGAPGGGTGTLGVYTLDLADGNATFRAQLNGTAPGSYDQVAAGFMATIGAGAILDVTVGFAASIGDTFTILIAGDGPVNGTFAGLPNNAFTMFSGQPFQITYPGSSVVLTRVLAVPVELQRFEAE